MLLIPLFQDTPPDTLRYLLLGCVFLIVLPALYVLSFFLRQRNLERDLETIETLTNEEKERPVTRAAAPPADAQRAEKPSQT